MVARNVGRFAVAAVSAGAAISSFNTAPHGASSSLVAAQRKERTVTTVACRPYNSRNRDVGSPWMCRAETRGHAPTGPLIFKSDKTSTLFDKECRHNEVVQVCTITYKGEAEGKHTVTAIYMGNHLDARSSHSTHVKVSAAAKVTTKITDTTPQMQAPAPSPSITTTDAVVPPDVVPVTVQPSPYVSPGPGTSTQPTTTTQPVTTTLPPTTTTIPPTTTTTLPTTTTTVPPTTTTTTTIPPTTTTTTVPQSPAPVVEYSSNWSGYVAFSSVTSPQPLVTSVSASWAVQSINTSVAGSTAAAVQWIGIGGVNGDQTLIQIGTGWNVAGYTNANFAWYEALPGFMIPIKNMQVDSGDIMSASVRLSNASQSTWTLTLTNDTTGQTFNTSTVYSASDLSAEVIDEAPGACTGTYVTGTNCTILPLADFGTASFTGAIATINGETAALGSFPTVDMIMTNSAGQQISVPSALQGGQNFTATWQGIGAGSGSGATSSAESGTLPSLVRD